ncbi:MAG: hypothetical protein WAJ87_20975 [Bryobacteraceae bacterium]
MSLQCLDRLPARAAPKQSIDRERAVKELRNQETGTRSWNLRFTFTSCIHAMLACVLFLLGRGIATAVLCLLLPLANAATVCPPGGPAEQGGVPGVLEWHSAAHGLAQDRYCFANQVRNLGSTALSVHWPDAGIVRAVVAGQLEMAFCCAPAESSAASKLWIGTPEKPLAIRMRREAEEGGADREEGYPDLIESDARVKNYSIRGSLDSAGATVQIDLALKCSASRFADRYAYQFAITDRSPVKLTVDWDLLQRMREVARPSVQTIPGGVAYVFLSDRTPEEAEGVIDIRTKDGGPLARLRLDGYRPSR